MSHQTRRLITALAAATTFVLASSAATLAAAADDVPFKGAYAGVLNPPHGPGPDGVEHLTGSGNATYLGASTNSGSGSITGTATNCEGGQVGYLVQNDEVLTSTDDGDQIKLTIHAEDCPVSPGVFKTVGSFVVTGGTGRFADARGSGNVTGSPDLNQGTFQLSLAGTISRPKHS